MPRIKTKNSTTSTLTPANGSLLQGELAVNITDKKLFVGDASGNPVEITNQGVTAVYGSTSGIYVTQATGSTVIGLDPDIYVSGVLQVSGVISTIGTAGSLFNDTALSVNIGGGASGVQIGHPTGTVVMGNIAVNSGTISTTALAGDIFNATAARINIGAAASGVKIGHATGVVVVGDIAVNNGAITTTSSTGSVFNTNIITANAFTSATLVNIATGNVFDPAEKVIKIGTTAGGDGGVTISIGSSSAGTTTINSPSTVFGGDVAVNGGDITTSNSLATIFNTTAARVNIGGGASGVQIGHPTGTVVMGNISATGYVSAASGYRIASAAINAQTATGYTLVSTDNGKIITFDSAATHTLRIPTGLDIGFNATIIQLGTGQVTCTGLSGATLNCYASGNKILGQHGSASVLCYASNVYNLAGTLGI